MVDAKIQCALLLPLISPSANHVQRAYVQASARVDVRKPPCTLYAMFHALIHRAVSTKSRKSKSTNSPPVLFPFSRRPSDRGPKCSYHAGTTESSLPVSRPLIDTVTWCSRTRRRCGRSSRGSAMVRRAGKLTRTGSSARCMWAQRRAYSITDLCQVSARRLGYPCPSELSRESTRWSYDLGHDFRSSGD
jgi:hypothetical protein